MTCGPCSRGVGEEGDMAREPELKGFQRLREVCQKNDLPMDCLAPKEPPVVAG